MKLNSLEKALAISLAVVTPIALISIGIIAQQVLLSMRVSSAIQESYFKAQQAQDAEAEANRFYPGLKEGDIHPQTKTRIVRDNYTSQLIVLPGERTPAYNYDPVTGYLTNVN